VRELWDTAANRLLAAGDTLPIVVSPDGRYGAEMHTGVFRLWRLDG
jgi:hypothetical protein